MFLELEMKVTNHKDRYIDSLINLKDVSYISEENSIIKIWSSEGCFEPANTFDEIKSIIEKTYPEAFLETKILTKEISENIKDEIKNFQGFMSKNYEDSLENLKNLILGKIKSNEKTIKKRVLININSLKSITEDKDGDLHFEFNKIFDCDLCVVDTSYNQLKTILLEKKQLKNILQ